MRFLLALGLILLGGYPAPNNPNGSDDGRYHSCAYITDNGVTSHLAAYHARCD